MIFPLKSGKDWVLTKEKYDYFDVRFPLVDIDAELDKMLIWLECCPPRRKTAGGMMNAIRFWLSNDKYGTQAKRKPKPIDGKEEQWDKQCGDWLRGADTFQMTNNDGFVARLADPEFRAWAGGVNEAVKGI
jgi:hypothetical protein